MQPEVTDQEVRHSLDRLSRICRIFAFGLTSVVGFMLLPMLLSPLILVGACFSIGPFSYTGSFVALALMMIQSVLTIASLWLIRKVFIDIAGKRPFYPKQSRSLLVAGLMMLVCTFTMSLPCNSASISCTIGSFFIGIDLAGQTPTSINLGTLLCSISLLTMSTVFKYGYLLQCISDDTV